MTLTPEQFNLIATKEDLKNFHSKDELDKKFDQVLTAIDGLAKKVDNLDHEFVANLGAHDRFETRITKIEKQLNPKPAF
jgi:hypothetical protein